MFCFEGGEWIEDTATGSAAGPLVCWAQVALQLARARLRPPLGAFPLASGSPRSADAGLGPADWSRRALWDELGRLEIYRFVNHVGQSVSWSPTPRRAAAARGT